MEGGDDARKGREGGYYDAGTDEAKRRATGWEKTAA